MTARKTVKPEDLSQAMKFYFGLFHPLYRECKLDKLTRYITKYCQEWMTEDERRTTQYLAFLRMSQSMTNQKGQTYRKNQANKLWNDRIEANLKDGEEVFHYTVKDRLISEYGNKPLNLCHDARRWREPLKPNNVKSVTTIGTNKPKFCFKIFPFDTFSQHN